MSHDVNHRTEAAKPAEGVVLSLGSVDVPVGSHLVGDRLGHLHNGLIAGEIGERYEKTTVNGLYRYEYTPFS